MHGDIDGDSYLCAVHNWARHPIAGLSPQWSDLALWFASPRELRTAPNVFAELALAVRKTRRGFRPYPDAPKLFACSSPEYRATVPIARMPFLRVTQAMRDDYPMVPWDALLAPMQPQQPGLSPAPQPPELPRYFCHGDIRPIGWYCAHHDGWHPGTHPIQPHAEDAKRLRYQLARLSAILGSHHSRPAEVDSVFHLPQRGRGRPNSNGVSPGWACEALGLTVSYAAR